MSRYPKLTINQSSSKHINLVNAASPTGYKAASVHQLLQGAWVGQEDDESKVVCLHEELPAAAELLLAFLPSWAYC